MTTLLDASGFTICVRHKLLERSKELVVLPKLGPRLPYPWHIEEPIQNMAIEDHLHVDPEFLTKRTPIAIVFGVDEQGCDQIDILNIQPAARPDQQVSSTACKWQLRFMDPAIVPPGEVSVKVAVRVIKDKSNSSGMVEARFKGCSEVSLRVPPQGVGA